MNIRKIMSNIRAYYGVKAFNELPNLIFEKSIPAEDIPLTEACIAFAVDIGHRLTAGDVINMDAYLLCSSYIYDRDKKAYVYIE